MSSSLNFNRLKNSKSLYLRQHQDNPIHWWNYGPEALAYAQENNRPIFLSVGYSSCHWCHVMAHEAFVDQSVANFLNEHFVAIKVDREEFPDIDNYYQKAAQLFGSNGGWPLSAFLLPDTRPFYVGTYFPLTSKDNGPNFPDLIHELRRAFDGEKEQVEKNAIQITESIKNGSIPPGEVQFEGHFPHPNGILEAVKEFRDMTWGGYGTTPKFPTFAYYEWAFEQMLEGMISKEHGEFIINSCERMLMGAINDHARGGMHRYSTDEKWLVPHFEKMLYDQAGFLRTMTKLSLVYPSPLVFDSLINMLDYLENEMLSDDKDGMRHFFSAQDADSEGVEGLYFTFSEAEFEDLINSNDDEEESLSKNMDKIKKWFQITSIGNFDHNLNVISMNPDLKEEFYQQENWDMVRKVRRAILNERKERMPPVTDNKGVASWNFMLISALVDVVQYSQIDVIKRMASNLINTTIEGVFKTFLTNSEAGMKMRHTTTVEFSHPYLEDFVFFAESQLRLFEISANDVFKQNFKDALQFVTKEFLDKDKMFTRAKLAEHFELYPNQEYNIFDASFKSPVATYIQLMRRAAVLFGDRNYLDTILGLKDTVTNTVLKVNPVSAGESLRALTYPAEAYRVMKLPKAWAQRDDFIKFIPFFLPRFVLDYHDQVDTSEPFEICTMTACEMKGSGFEEFTRILTPAQE
ncbi:MAG: thioredoxin domain-containing protein [Bacteriovorax sp.]|nr:thioredoxin domain-containing protein [Bacteriovorax sp.]